MKKQDPAENKVVDKSDESLRSKNGRLETNFRYADAEHHAFVRRAAKKAKSSINGWLIRVTLVAARRELKIK